jgi:hypothetical protein
VAYVVNSGPLSSFFEMEKAASSLASTGILGNIYSPHSGPSAHISPIYASLLAVIYFVFEFPSPKAVLFQQLFAVLLSSVNIALIPMYGPRMGFSFRAAAIAGFVMALLPINLGIETSGSWEQPLASIVNFTLLYLFVKAISDNWKSKRLRFSIGILLGGISLLCPSLLISGLFLIAIQPLLFRNHNIRIYSKIGVIVLVAALINSPWLVRNYFQFKSFIPLRSNFGLELWLGNNPNATGRTHTYQDDNYNFKSNHPCVSKIENEKILKEGEVAYMHDKFLLATTWIRRNPFSFLLLTTKRLRYYWIPNQSLWNPGTPILRIKMLIFIIGGVGTLLGLAYVYTKNRSMAWAFGGWILGCFIVYALTHVELHYRYPLWVLSALLSVEILHSVYLFLECVARKRYGVPQKIER